MTVQFEDCVLGMSCSPIDPNENNLIPLRFPYRNQHPTNNNILLFHSTSIYLATESPFTWLDLSSGVQQLKSSVNTPPVSETVSYAPIPNTELVLFVSQYSNYPDTTFKLFTYNLTTDTFSSVTTFAHGFTLSAGQFVIAEAPYCGSSSIFALVLKNIFAEGTAAACTKLFTSTSATSGWAVRVTYNSATTEVGQVATLAANSTKFFFGLERTLTAGGYSYNTYTCTTIAGTWAAATVLSSAPKIVGVTQMEFYSSLSSTYILLYKLASGVSNYFSTDYVTAYFIGETYSTDYYKRLGNYVLDTSTGELFKLQAGLFSVLPRVYALAIPFINYSVSFNYFGGVLSYCFIPALTSDSTLQRKLVALP